MLFCGVDPGLSGALAFLTVYSNGTKTLKIYKTPVNAQGVDGYKLVMLLNTWKPDHLILEDQFAHKNGKMSRQSILTSGRNWGLIMGVAQALQIPTTVVLPVTWQSVMAPKRLFRYDNPKERSMAAARKWGPPGFDFQNNDGFSDATLLAVYGSLYFPHT